MTRHYEQPMQVTSTREHLERERQHIAEQTAAFLARGGEIDRPGPRQTRLIVPGNRSATTTRVYAEVSSPIQLGTLRMSTRAQRSKGGRRG